MPKGERLNRPLAFFLLTLLRYACATGLSQRTQSMLDDQHDC